MDECRIIRWLVLPDVFKNTDELKPSEVFPRVTDADPLVVRWMVDSDTWSIPKPSAIFPAPTTDDTKIARWKVDQDAWNITVELTTIRPKITPTHLYDKQHTSCLVEFTAFIDNIPQEIKVMLNDVEVSTFSLGRAVSIPIGSFKNGANIIELVSRDGAVARYPIVLEEKHRTIVERTFTSIDGGYIITSN